MHEESSKWLRKTAPLVALVAGSAAWLASCRLGPDYQRPALDVPTAFGGAATQPAGQGPSPAATQSSSPPPRNWWQLFGDDDLTTLEQTAVAHNQNLKAALSRVAEARAAAREVKSEFYPQIALDPGLQDTIRARGKPTTQTNIPFDLAYEIDVWGQVARSLESANATARASADDFAVVLLTLEADVAQDYLTLRALQNQDRIYTENVKATQDQLELTNTKFSAGLVGNIDIAQEQTQLDTIIPQQMEIRREMEDEAHALAILLGVPPSEFSLPVHTGPTEPPVIPPGLPAELLRHRPDVAEAEQNLVAANANVGVAITQFYPTFQLTGAAGYESVDLTHALDWQSAILQFGPSVTMPIFTGGRLKANLQQAQARYQELLATYRNTLLTAFNDVETSLTDVHMYANSLKAQHQAVLDSRRYLDLTQTEYNQGLQSQLQVLDAQRTLLSNELTEAQLLNNRLVATVLLIKAIGGGWDASAPLKTPPPTTLPAVAQPATEPAPVFGEGAASAPASAPASQPATAP